MKVLLTNLLKVYGWFFGLGKNAWLARLARDGRR